MRYVLFAMLALGVMLVLQIARLSSEQAKRELERQRQSQIEKLEALGQLTGGIAHDFSNVLQIVELNVEALRNGRIDSSAAEEAIDNTIRAVRDATAMVGRLLRFSRKKRLTLSTLRLAEWLEAARPLLSQAGGPGIEVEVETRGRMPEVPCDPIELDMALVNLIVNARHAMNGSGRVVVRAYPCEPEESGLPRRFVASPPQVSAFRRSTDSCSRSAGVFRSSPAPDAARSCVSSSLLRRTAPDQRVGARDGGSLH